MILFLAERWYALCEAKAVIAITFQGLAQVPISGLE